MNKVEDYTIGIFEQLLKETDQLTQLNKEKQRSITMDKAAAHAINQHDKLVQINKDLVKTLEFNLSNPAIHHKTREEFKVLINKAKELTK